MINIRKRGNSYQYYFEIASVNGKKENKKQNQGLKQKLKQKKKD